MMAPVDFSFASASGRGDIIGRYWPVENPKALMFLSHGMAEHGARYGYTATRMNREGIAFFSHDHIGHGASCPDGLFGYFAPRDGIDILLSDLHQTRRMMEALYPGLPVFLLGHSMGSFLARLYIVKYDGLSGCILSGTTAGNPAMGFGKALSRLTARKKPSKFIDRLAFSNYVKGIPRLRSAFDWLTRDDEQVRLYLEDPLCGFPFTGKGFHDLFTMIQQISSPDWAEKVPMDLPLLLLSGERDPVGPYKRVCEVAQRLQAAGHENVEMRLYPGARHEILNEINKDEVLDDIAAWIDRVL